MICISTVIPCYNGEGYVGETISSALAQTHSPLEVIVIDDGSTDDSASIAEAFGPPVRVIRQENQGESVARNRGVDESRGEWVAFLDADDLWEKTKLERQIAAVQPDVIGVHTNVRSFGAAEGVSDFGACAPEHRYQPSSMVHRLPIHISSLLIRRDVVPRFDESVRFGEDLLFALDICSRGVVTLVREPLTLYRRHVSNQSRNPAAPIEWHRSVSLWLERNAGRISDEQLMETAKAADQQLVQHAQKRKWQRDWDALDAIRAYAASLPESRQRFSEMPAKVLPQSLYELKDWWTKSVTSRAKLDARTDHQPSKPLV